MAKMTDEQLVEGSEYWPTFRNMAFVQAQQQPDGSYLVHGSKGDVWTVSEHDFNLNYKPVTPNKS